MELRKELSSLLIRVALEEGCNANGAIRDVMTDLIHISRLSGLDASAIFASALEVADEEGPEPFKPAPESVEERYDRKRQEIIDRRKRAIDRTPGKSNGGES